MSKIGKKLLDELIELQRRRGDMSAYDRDELSRLGRMALDKCAEIEAKWPEISMYAIENFTYSIFGFCGMNKNAANEDAYKALACFGWEVIEDV